MSMTLNDAFLTKMLCAVRLADVLFLVRAYTYAQYFMLLFLISH